MPEVSAGPTETKIIRASGVVTCSNNSSGGNMDKRAIPPATNSSERQKNSSIINDGNTVLNGTSNIAEAPAKPRNPLEGWMPRDNRDITRDMYEVRDNRELAREISLASGRGVPAPLRDLTVAPIIHSRRPLGGFGFGSDAGAEDSAAAELLRKEREREQAALVRGAGYHAGRGAPRERDVNESALSQPHRPNTDVPHVRQTREAQPARPERAERGARPEVVSSKDGDRDARGTFVESKAVAAAALTPVSAVESRAADKRERQRKEKEERLRSRVDTDNGIARASGPERSVTAASNKQTVQLVDKTGKLSGNKKVEAIRPVDAPVSEKPSDKGTEIATSAPCKEKKEKKPRLSEEEFAAQKAAKKAERMAKKSGGKAGPAAVSSGVGTFTLTANAMTADVPAGAVDSDDEPEPVGASSSIPALSTSEQNQLAKKEKAAKIKKERREREKGKRGVMFSEEKAGPAAADLSDLSAFIDRLDFAGLSQLASPVKSAHSAHNASGVSGDIDGDLYGAASCLEDDTPSHVVVGSVLGGILDDLEGPEDNIFGSNSIPAFSDGTDRPATSERAPRGGRTRGGKARGGRGRGEDSVKSDSHKPALSSADAPKAVPDERSERVRGGRGRGRGGRKGGDWEEGGGGRGRSGEAGRSSRGRGPASHGPTANAPSASHGPPANIAR